MSEELGLNEVPPPQHGIIARLQEWQKNVALWVEHKIPYYLTKRHLGNVAIVGLLSLGLASSGCGGNVSAESTPESATPTSSTETSTISPSPEAEEGTDVDELDSLEPFYTQALFEQAFSKGSWPGDGPESAQTAYNNFLEIKAHLEKVRSLDTPALLQLTREYYARHQESLKNSPNIGFPSNFHRLQEGLSDPSVEISEYEYALNSMLTTHGSEAWFPKDASELNPNNLEPVQFESPEGDFFYRATMLNVIEGLAQTPSKLIELIPTTYGFANVVMPSSDGYGEASAYATQNGDRHYIVFDATKEGGYDYIVTLRHEMGHRFAREFGSDGVDLALNELYPSGDLPSRDVADWFREWMIESDNFLTAEPPVFQVSSNTGGQIAITTAEALSLFQGEMPSDFQVASFSQHSLRGGNEVFAGIWEWGMSGQELSRTNNVPPESLCAVAAQFGFLGARLDYISPELGDIYATGIALSIARAELEGRLGNADISPDDIDSIASALYETSGQIPRP